jgi:hypothetical protein
MNDINDVRRVVRRIPTNHAEETLGVWIAPDGNMITQVKKLLDKALQWADQMRTGVIRKDETWLALHSTIWRTLSYPLNAVNITNAHWEKIMFPIINFALPAMGVCRKFPRDLVFSSYKFAGMGIRHLHTLQEIARLTDILHHTYINSTMGLLYRTSWEYLILEIGISHDISAVNYNKYKMLATNSLVKNTWEFLQTHGITLSHDISVPKNTLNDYILMTELCRLTLSHTELDSINQCRLYLKAYYISDLATASGKRLSKHTWQGQPRFEGRTSTCSWPTQARPSDSAWIIWRNTLKRTILSRGLLLKTAIGPWLRNDLDIWKWYYASAVDCLLEVKPNETLLYYRNTKSVANNTFGPVGKKIEEFPRHLQKASVEPLKRGLFQLIDTGELSTPQQ